MSDSCKILAAATVEGLEVFGQSSVPQIYVCTSVGIYAAPAAPIVCGSAAIATAVGKWATTPAGKELMTMAAEKSCDIVVEVGQTATEIMIVQAENALEDIRKTTQKAEKTYKALNTPQGISWLMRYMSGM